MQSCKWTRDGRRLAGLLCCNCAPLPLIEVAFRLPDINLAAYNWNFTNDSMFSRRQQALYVELNLFNRSTLFFMALSFPLIGNHHIISIMATRDLQHTDPWIQKPPSAQRSPSIWLGDSKGPPVGKGTRAIQKQALHFTQWRGTSFKWGKKFALSLLFWLCSVFWPW